MSLPEEFMHDADVIAALDQMNTALNNSLKARGFEVKTLVVVAHTTSGQDGAALIGCDCIGCKHALADVFGEAIGAKATMIKLPKSFGTPAKGMH